MYEIAQVPSINWLTRGANTMLKFTESIESKSISDGQDHAYQNKSSKDCSNICLKTYLKLFFFFRPSPAGLCLLLKVNEDTEHLHHKKKAQHAE